MHKRPLHLSNGKGKQRYGHTGSSQAGPATLEQVGYCPWGYFFLEIFLCLVIYMYIMGLVSGHWLLLEPLGLLGAG